MNGAVVFPFLVVVAVTFLSSAPASADASTDTSADLRGGGSASGSEPSRGRVARSEMIDAPRRMRAPSLDRWRPIYAATSSSAHVSRLVDSASSAHVVIAEGFNAPIFRSRKAARVLGRVRRGNVLAVIDRGSPCGPQRDGRWYEVDGGGWVCTARDFRLAALPLAKQEPQRQPAVERALPFRYGRVTERGAPRWSRIPTLEEERAPSRAAPLVELMEGDFFLALDERVVSEGRTFWRTIEGEYVRADVVDVRDTPPLVGERLGEEGSPTLPLAFVFGEEPAPLACVRGGSLEPCGVADKHARFPVERRLEHEGETWLVSAEGLAVPESRLRIAERRRAPARVPDEDKWVHIDLSQQTLVAYEGDRPVYATLISSGKPSHATPTGLFRTRRKYLSKTMRGKDPKDGIYHVEEVPWTLYYHRGWAVHGAYWHNTFGAVRSHGCTNVAPADARWLYHWADLEVPDGWHAVVGREGTWFWFTRDRS